MEIHFLCPNGHELSCPEEQAGREGQCPHCGDTFIIPEFEEESETFDEAVAAQPNVTKSDSGPRIEFLCPNGHHLRGPEKLAGRAGQCPHCGVKFRIPTIDETEIEETGPHPATDPQPLVEEEGNKLEFSSEASPEIVEQEAAEEPVAATIPDEAHLELRLPQPEERGPLLQEAAQGASVPKPEAVAELFARLWNMRPIGSTVKLELAGGGSITPELFAPELSRQTHGVFAVKDANGTHTISAIAWQSVVRINLGGVRELPEGWFV